MKSRILHCALVLVLGVFAAQPALADDWLRADTRNFVIYSDGSEKDLQEFATSVERFDTLMRALFNRPQPEQPNRLTIYMLSSQRSVSRLKGQRYVAGFYSPDMEGSYAVTNRTKTSNDYALTGQITLFHEYAHHFMYRNFSFAYPGWYTEGFAEYVSTVGFDKDGKWTLGYPALHRAWDISTGSIPIETLLFEDRDELSSSRLLDFYAWSWALVHMLNFNQERAGQLEDYLVKFGSGTDPREAAAVFGDLDELEKELNQYPKGKLSYKKSRVPLPLDMTYRLTRLDSVASELVELSLARKAGKDLEDTLEDLRKLAASAPGNAAVALELGLAERDAAREAEEPDFALAEAAADRALAIDPQNARANLLKAEMMIRRLRDEPDAPEDEWNVARRHIIAANRLDPADPLPLIRYYQFFATRGIKPPDIAFDGMTQAFNTIPESREARMIYVFAMAGKGDFDEAIKRAQVLASDPHSSSAGKRALAVLEQMKQNRELVVSVNSLVDESAEADTE